VIIYSITLHLDVLGAGKREEHEMAVGVCISHSGVRAHVLEVALELTEAISIGKLWTVLQNGCDGPIVPISLQTIIPLAERTGVIYAELSRKRIEKSRAMAHVH
jgi:hypothetical protein